MSEQLAIVLLAVGVPLLLGVPVIVALLWMCRQEREKHHPQA